METRRNENRPDVVPTTRLCCECSGHNLASARFCRHCGKPLAPVQTSVGRAFHPQPLSPPPGMKPVERTAHLFMAIESAWGGGPLLGTEPLSLAVFNAGYPLSCAVFQIEGLARDGTCMFRVERIAAQVPRGQITRVDVASYEIPEPVQDVRLTLVSAEYA